MTPNEAKPLGTDPDWWRQAVVYQIYPRSFADNNGDGLGDLNGITSRVSYLVELGVDAVWLSPFYPSELADGGYDVANYRDVDPRLGTLEDFDRLVAALHGRGIRIIVDIVPNHTSDQHEWFQAALAAGPGSPERDRYIFRDGAGPDGNQPPADWVSDFGGPAWEQVPDGQWYMHHFATEQPDLNWANDEVRADFIATLRFWSDRGVDGFRIDVAHMLTKDLTQPLPTQAELDALPIDGHHPIFDRDDVHDIYASWRKVLNSYDPPRTAVAEAWVDSSRIPRYAHPDSLGQAFNFDLLEADFDAAQFRDIIRQNLDLAAQSGSSSTWVLSNHDVVRHATRYGLPHSQRDDQGKLVDRPGWQWLRTGGSDPAVDLDRGLRRARAATMLILALPGSTYLYQGEELGLPEVVEIRADERQDPHFFRTGGKDIGRDGCRVPLPWIAAAPGFGFGGATPHLPQPAWFGNYAVDVQDSDESSTLNLYRQILHVRHSLVSGENLDWIETERYDVLAFARSAQWHVVTNFGDEPYRLPGSSAMRVVASSAPVIDGILPGESTAWLVPM
ncbi:alpha-glucosidase [Micrococcales bacterium KH10]|nr:alpha-glucosidase [Micrococcales bacterium KH10]